MRTRGFTLIEMVVSIGIFLVIITIGMSAMIGTIEANRKSQASTLVLSNLSLAIEAMSKSLRVAYSSTASGSYTGGGTYIQFIPASGVGTVRYEYDSGTHAIKRTTDNGSGGVYISNITAPEVYIDELTFTIINTVNTQPKVRILLRGHVGEKITSKSEFYIQSLVSQRITPTL